MFIQPPLSPQLLADAPNYVAALNNEFGFWIIPPFNFPTACVLQYVASAASIGFKTQQLIMHVEGGIDKGGESAGEHN